MSCSSFLHKILFGILSVHVLCDSAMTSLEGREGEMRHRGLMAPRELGSLLRQRCVAWACKASQARHKACVVKPGFWLGRSGIQDMALFPERQALTMRKACNKSFISCSQDSLLRIWQMSRRTWGRGRCRDSWGWAPGAAGLKGDSGKSRGLS